MKANEILVFDTETQDIPDWKSPSDGPDQPHLVAVCGLIYDTVKADVTQSLNLIIRPDGWVSSPEALEIHGITHEYAMDVGVSEKLATEMFIEFWGGRHRVAFNTTFDNRLIRIASKRFLGEEVADTWKAGEYTCAMIAAKKAMGLSKYPKLEDAYLHLTGKQFENAHNAEVDAYGCLEVYLAVKKREQLAA